VDNPYAFIGSQLAQVCPAPFDKAWLEAKLDEGHSSVRYWCDAGGRQTQPDVPAVKAFEIDAALDQLRQQAVEQSGRAWSSCTFTLFPDGEFKFDARYDD
jgi:hypothetical protein